MTMMKLFESPRLTHSGRFTFQTKYHLERLLLPLPDVVTTHDSHCITFGEETTKACSTLLLRKQMAVGHGENAALALPPSAALIKGKVGQGSVHFGILGSGTTV